MSHIFLFVGVKIGSNTAVQALHRLGERLKLQAVPPPD